MTAVQLPRSLDEMAQATSLVFTPEAWEAGLAFEPRPDDVIISPWGKSGTTWLQQIVHGLRSGGDMAFDDISRVIPWIEVAQAVGQDLVAEQAEQPRAFKSHLSYTDVPKGARYIVSLRDPRSVLVSNYRFMEGWFFEPGAFSINDYALERWLGRSDGHDYWSHMESWWARRGTGDLLLLSFELMKENLAATVERVANFIGIGADDSLLALVERQASLEFMLAHGDRFDDLLIRSRATAIGALPPGAASSKVTSGAVGQRRYDLSAETVRLMEVSWRDTMGARFGLDSYEELVAELQAAEPSRAPR